MGHFARLCIATELPKKWDSPWPLVLTLLSYSVWWTVRKFSANNSCFLLTLAVWMDFPSSFNECQTWPYDVFWSIKWGRSDSVQVQNPDLKSHYMFLLTLLELLQQPQEDEALSHHCSQDERQMQETRTHKQLEAKRLSLIFSPTIKKN